MPGTVRDATTKFNNVVCSYCPDSPVTRRQMAIFIAKALGLNWPY